MSNALAQCVDLELADRSTVEIASAYRALCAAILLRTAMVARAKTPPRKMEVEQKRTALSWVDGGQGLITFEEACQALEMQPERARSSIHTYAQARGDRSINTMSYRPRSRTVFGRRNHAPRTDEALGEAATPHGVDACSPDDPRNRCVPAGA